MENEIRDVREEKRGEVRSEKEFIPRECDGDTGNNVLLYTYCMGCLHKFLRTTTVAAEGD